MQDELKEIRDQQRVTWNRFSGGWKKWDEFNMLFLKPMGDAIIQKLQLKSTDKVLDIATGTGEPAITIASIVVDGKVTAIDLAQQMLETAKDNATQKGFENFEAVVADASDLPFAKSSFDKISCRMGFMFFPDMLFAAKEMHRVLCEGGKIATSVWFTPQKNTWTSGILNIINTNMQIPPPPVNTPSIFRCAEQGLVKSLLEDAGFKNVEEQEINGKIVYESFDYFWTMMNEVAAPVVGAMAKADETMRQKIKNETEAFIKQHTTENGVELEYSSLVISGEK